MSEPTPNEAQDDAVEAPEPREEPVIKTTDSENLVGHLLAGRYEIERAIGRGGMGVVYLARQTNLDRTVVIKLLRRNLEDEPEALARFEREARGLSRLQHPNIVTIHDFGQENDQAFIVMEYVRGETLARALRREKHFRMRDFGPIAAQILKGIGEAHALGMLHRDIKPSNIMLCERYGHSNYVKILDFGLAKLASSASEITKDHQLVGSAAFLAPEQIVGENTDQRVDVYALGVLFYYMLSGRRPFQGKDDLTVLYKHVHEEPKPLEDVLPEDQEVPRGVIELIMKCLAKDPDERPQDANEMMDFLSFQVSGLSIQLPWATGEFSPLGPEGAEDTGPSFVTSLSEETGSRSFSSRLKRPEDISGPIETDSSITGSTLALDDPSQRKSPVIPIVIGAVALALIGAVAFVMTSGGETDTTAPAEAATATPSDESSAEDDAARVDETLALVQGLVDEGNFGQAEQLLDTIKDKTDDPQHLVRIAELSDSITISQLLERASRLEKEGDMSGAIGAYEEVLNKNSRNEEAQSNLDRLRSMEAKKGTIVVESSVPAFVYINGTQVGKTSAKKPYEGEFVPGTFQIDVKATGYVTQSREVTLESQEKSSLQFALKKEVTAAAAPVRRPTRKKTTRKKREEKKPEPKTTTPDPVEVKKVEEKKVEEKKVEEKKKSTGGLLLDGGGSRKKEEKKKSGGDLLLPPN